MKALIDALLSRCMDASRRAISRVGAGRSARKVLSLWVPGLLLGFLAGCGSSVKPQLGSISVVDSADKSIVPAQLTSLSINRTAKVSVSVGQDSNSLGVTWVGICGGSPISPPGSNPCGTIAQNGSTSMSYTAPAYIPVGNVVTLVASAVNDPSITSRVTIAIAPLPIQITLSTPPPVALGRSATALLAATLTNDTTAAGVTWKVTCGSASCGTLQSTLPNTSQTASGGQIAYTAPTAIPAGGTVTITATSVADPRQSISATVAIFAVSVTPATATAQVNGSLLLTAFVAIDPAGLGVDWTLSCGTAGACGSIAPHTASGAAATYVSPSTVPVGGIVTATATSTADTTKSASSTITIVPAISIAFTSAPPATVAGGSTTNLSATVTNDPSSAGVDWTVACATAPCGSFSPSSHVASGATVAYLVPIGIPAGTATITATSTASTTTPPVRSVSASVTVVPVIAVSFVPYAPSRLQQSDSTALTPATVPLTAVVANDPTAAGIDWSVCSAVATCGQFQVTPALAATATTPAANATYATTIHTSNGRAALYVPPSSVPTGGTVAVMAKSHNPAATSAGTAVAAIQIVQTPKGVALQGTVLAGAKPVAGASVYLYAAGTTGYNSAATPLTIAATANNVVTGTAGQFTISDGYTCPSQASQMYLVALGGNVGAGANPNLAMTTALGPCSGLSSAVSLIVNEVTTVASVWALAPFMSDYGHLGSSSANATNGLANAFATVNNLVNVTSGQALALTPAGNGVVPYAEIDTLASILNSCTVTSGGVVGDGTKCGALFNAANPGAIPSTAPSNTLQAALNIAQTPSYNTTPGTGSVYSLLPSPAAFLPVLTTAPNDWAIAINFTGGGLITRSAATALAIDASGSVWISNSRFSSVTQFNSLGVALSPTGTGTVQATAGGYQGGGLLFPTAVAIDLLGDAWVANSGSLSELPATLSSTYSGTLPGSSFTGGGLGSQVKGLAIDGSSNVWAVTSGSAGALSWFAGTNATINGTATLPGTALSPSAGFTQGINAPSGALGLDTAGTVWVLNSGNNTAAEFSIANGSFIQTDYGYTETVPVPVNSVLSPGVANALAIDNTGNVYLSPGSQLVQLKAGGSLANAGGLGSASVALGVNYSQFLALDGGGHVWVLATGGSTNCISAYSLIELSTGGAQQNINATGCGYLGPAINASDTGIAVDGSGDVWVLNGGSLTEFVGAAAPVVTPFSAGVANKTLGKRP